MRLALIARSLTIAAITAGCSDNGSPAPAKQAPKEDPVTVPSALPPPGGPYTIIVKGKGTVGSLDGSVTCPSDGTTTATCSAPHYGTVLYAGAALGWGFDHWEPSMSTDASLALESWTYSPLTAIFTKLPPIPGADY